MAILEIVNKDTCILEAFVPALLESQLDEVPTTQPSGQEAREVGAMQGTQLN